MGFDISSFPELQKYLPRYPSGSISPIRRYMYVVLLDTKMDRELYSRICQETKFQYGVLDFLPEDFNDDFLDGENFKRPIGEEL